MSIVSTLNEAFALRNDSLMFSTLLVGMLDLGTGELVYYNAGHNPPLLLCDGARIVYPNNESYESGSGAAATSKPATGGWREFGSKDAAGKPVTGHNAYGKVLSASEAQDYLSKESVLGW